MTEKDGISSGSEEWGLAWKDSVFSSDNRPFIPQFLPLGPTLNGAASYLSQTTTLLTSCFSDYSVDYHSTNPAESSLHEQELVTFPLQRSRPVDNQPYLTEPIFPHSEPSISLYPDVIDEDHAVGPPIYDSVSRTSNEPSTSSIVPANDNDSPGISLFQRLIEKARKTVRGSADDIGWLKRAPDMPAIEDGTVRYTEILNDIRHGIHRLPNSLVYVLVPGLFSNHGPLYFVNVMNTFSKMGLTCHIAKIHSEVTNAQHRHALFHFPNFIKLVVYAPFRLSQAAVEKNAREIKDFIEEIYRCSKKRVMLLGHSKGGIDSAAALSLYWTDLRDKVAGLALAQSPYGGSPIASDILREGQLGDYINVRKMMEIIVCKVLKGDIQALEDLTYEKRKEFLTKHHLPKELPLVSFSTEVAITPAVLATLSRVAHAEFPILSPLSSGQGAILPVVIPLGAAMAACAQLLQTRYNEKSDGLVTCRDAEVPGSVAVRPHQKMDHAWMVYSSPTDGISEATASQMCEALLTLLLEAGQSKRLELSLKCD